MVTQATTVDATTGAQVASKVEAPVDLAISIWLDPKAKRTGSAQTERAYRHTVESFRQACRTAGGDLDTADARALAKLLQGWAGHAWPGVRPTEAASFNQRVGIVGSFYTFARKPAS